MNAAIYLLPCVTAFHISATPPHRALHRSPAMTAADPLECQIDEPALECSLRRQIDGPWADVWARYVLLRPGMTFSEVRVRVVELRPAQFLRLGNQGRARSRRAETTAASVFAHTPELSLLFGC